MDSRDLYFWEMDTTDDESLEHYGTRHEGSIPHSGRYPWGSGENPHQHATSFLAAYRSLKAKGLTEKEIATAFGMNTRQLRDKKAADNAKERKIQIDQAIALAAKGMGATAIAREMSKTQGREVRESTVRGYLNPRARANNAILENTANALKEAVDKDKYIDVGKGVELYMGVTADKLTKAIGLLTASGKYEVRNDISVRQISDANKMTTLRLLVPKGTTAKEILANKDMIRMPGQQTEDGGLTYDKKEPIKNIDSKRIYVRYAEEGGADKDGVIELRRGVDDLNLGQAHYAQVRIGVKADEKEWGKIPESSDNKMYLKGMAVYGDFSDPKYDGFDIILNSNRKRGAPGEKVFKPQKYDKKTGEIEDPSNPFGSSIEDEEKLIRVQRHYVDKDGNRQLSALNIVKEEGAWSKWSKNLASQFLSKQEPELARKQLSLDASFRKNEFEKINSLTNPTIRKELLEAFGDECDSAAVHLKAAALPRQATKVILPIPSLKDDEIYAPSYNHGEEVILVRYPHEGIFEIPRLKVNNSNPEGRAIMGKNPIDAIGITPKTASTLSGADFDGDTVLVIPTKGYNLRSEKSLNKKELKAIESLKTFDTKAEFPYREGMEMMGKKGGSKEHRKMGEASNLITDMTLQGAPIEELVRATKYAMVVIDAAKHKLDFKSAYNAFGIKELQKTYQPKENGRYGGAGTLISKAKGQAHITRRTSRGYDPETGEKLWLEKPDIYSKRVVKKDGTVEWVPTERTQTSTKMYEAKDAYELSSGHVMESVYADYANYMKALGNEARKAAWQAGRQEMKRNPSAAKVYENEVNSLKAKLNTAKKNKPLERQAQLVANKIVELKKHAAKETGEELGKDEIKKIKFQALKDARARTGADKSLVYITDKEWEAIQAGAISKTELTEIWKNSDQDRAKSLAMPKQDKSLAPSVVSRINAMKGNYTIAEIAEYLGISTSTVEKYV